MSKHGEFVLREHQMQYLSGITGRPPEVLSDLLRRAPHEDRVELKRAVRQCLHDPSTETIKELFIVYMKTRGW